MVFTKTRSPFSAQPNFGSCKIRFGPLFGRAKTGGIAPSPAPNQGRPGAGWLLYEEARLNSEAKQSPGEEIVYQVTLILGKLS